MVGTLRTRAAGGWPLWIRFSAVCAVVAAFFAVAASAEAATYYWFSDGGNTSVATNWSTTDPGAGCSGLPTPPIDPPGAADDVIFHAECDYNATVDAALSVLSITMQSGYTGTVTQGASNITVGSGGFSSSGGTLTGGSGTFDLNGSFTLSGGTFTAPSGTFTVSGNFTVSSGTFTPGTNTVTFDGTSQSINANTTFYNFTKIEGANDATDETLTFGASKTVTISNTWTLDGRDSDDRINLVSSTPTTAWRVNPQGTRTLDFIDVTDSNNINATAISCLNNCVNGGNNTNWTFDYALSGTVYSDEGSTALGNMTVRVAIDGTDFATTAESNATTGAWSISGITATAGQVLTVYLEDETQDAVLVTVAPGSAISTLNLYQDRLITRHDNSGSLTNSNLSTAAVASETDISNIYSVSAGALTVASAKELFVWASHTFAPGGTVTADDIDINGTFTMSSNAVSVSGTWDATGGSFTGSNTVTFTATSGTEDIISDGDSFNNLTINGSGGTFEVEDAMDVNGTLTITAGTLDTKSGENNSITVGNGWTDTGAGLFTERSGTVTFDGTGTVNSNDNFNNVTINASGGTVTLGAALDVEDTVTITAGALDVSGSNFSITAKSWTDTGAGTFTEGTGTVTFDVFGGTINSNEAFNNVTINHVDTTTLGAALDVNDTLTISNGLLDVSAGNNYGITTKSWSTPGIGDLVERSGTVTFDVAGGTITATGAFNNVTINHAGTTTLGSALDVNGTLTLTSGTLDVSGTSYGITIGVDWNNSGGAFTEQSGTVTFDGSGAQALTGETFYNLTINNSAASPGDSTDVDSSAAVTVTNTLTVTDGQFQPTTASDFNGNVTISTNGILKPDASASITVFGNWANTGTFTHNSGTVTFDNTAADQTITTAGQAFNALTLNNTGASGSDDLIISGALDVDGTFTITDGDLDISTNDPNVNIAADMTIGANGTIDNSAYTGTWTFDGTGTDTLTDNTTSGTNFRAVTVDGTSSKVVNFGSGANTPTFTFTTLTIGTDDTVDLSGENTTVTTLVNNGTYRMQGGETVTITTKDTDSGTVEYDGTASYLTALAYGNTYYSLLFSGSGTWEPDGTVTVNGNLTISDGVFDIDAQNLTLSGTSTFSNVGTLRLRNTETLTNVTNDTDSGTIEYDGSGSFTSLKLGNTYQNVTFNNASGTWTLEATLDANNNLTVTAGALALNGFDLTVGGSISNSGTLSGTSGRTLTLDGNAQSVDVDGATFATVAISSGAGTVTMASNITTSSSVTVASGDTLALSSFTWTSNGSMTNSGTITEGTGKVIDLSSGFYIADSNFDIDDTISLGSERIYLTITDEDGNLSGSSANTISSSVVVTCANGAFTDDSETVTLTETGNATEVFRYTTGILTALGDASVTANDGTLECQNNETITATFTDPQDASDTASDTATGTTDTLPTAPSGFSCTAASSTTASCSWTDNSSNESGFRIRDGSNNVLNSPSANATSATVSGLTASTSYTLHIVAYNGAGNSSNSNTSTFTTDAASGNSAPSATSLSTPSQATDGSGYMTFQLLMSDPDNNRTRLRIQYSLDDGSNWYQAYIVAASSTAGAMNIDNGSTVTYQLSNIPTHNGNAFLTVTWNSQHADNGGGAVGGRQQLVRIRVTPNDSTTDGTAVTSDRFTIDNEAPRNLGNFAVTVSGGTNIFASWRPVNEEVFDHYELWYGRGSAQVAARTAGTLAKEWDADNDSALRRASTSSTRISNISPDGTYTVKLWAVDTFGNEATVASKTVQISAVPGASATTVIREELSSSTPTVGEVIERIRRGEQPSRAPQALQLQELERHARIRREREADNLQAFLARLFGAERMRVLDDWLGRMIAAFQNGVRAFALALRDRALAALGFGRTQLVAIGRALQATREELALDRQGAVTRIERQTDPSVARVSAGAYQELANRRDAAFNSLSGVLPRFTARFLVLGQRTKYWWERLLIAARENRLTLASANEQRIAQFVNPAVSGLRWARVGARVAYEGARGRYAEPLVISNVAVELLSSSRVAVTWDTNRVTRGKLNYGLSPAYGDEVHEPEYRAHHRVELPELEPNTKYFFEVLATDLNNVQTFDAYYSFTTLEK